MIDYLYLEKLKSKKYQVIKIKVFNNDRFEAELKARTYAKRHKLGKLAGGYFSENCKPYDFKENYKVYNCPDNTPVSKQTKHDKFIADLIEYENNMEYQIFW